MGVRTDGSTRVSVAVRWARGVGTAVVLTVALTGGARASEPELKPIVLPPGNALTIAVGGSRRFAVTVTAKDVEYRWTVDGRPIGAERTFEYVPDSDAIGVREVAVTVVRGGAASRHAWRVTVEPPPVPKVVVAEPAEAVVHAPGGKRITFRYQVASPIPTDRVEIAWAVDGVEAGTGSSTSVDAEAGISKRIRAVATSTSGVVQTREWRLVGRAETVVAAAQPGVVEPDEELERMLRTMKAEQPPPTAAPRPRPTTSTTRPRPTTSTRREPTTSTTTRPVRTTSTTAVVTTSTRPPTTPSTRPMPSTLPPVPTTTSTTAPPVAIARAAPPTTTPAPPPTVPRATPPTTVARARRQSPPTTTAVRARPPRPPRPPTTVPARPPPTLLAAARVPPTTLPPPAGIDRTEVDAFLRRYARAYEARSVGELRRIGQIRSERQAEALARYFEQVSDLEVRVQLLDVRPHGDGAIVRYQRHDRFRDPTGRVVDKETPPIEKEIRRTADGLVFSD